METKGQSRGNRICHHFAEGNCKHGMLCRYSHSRDWTDAIRQQRRSASSSYAPYAHSQPPVQRSGRGPYTGANAGSAVQRANAKPPPMLPPTRHSQTAAASVPPPMQPPPFHSAPAANQPAATPPANPSALATANTHHGQPKKYNWNDPPYQAEADTRPHGRRTPSPNAHASSSTQYAPRQDSLHRGEMSVDATGNTFNPAPQPNTPIVQGPVNQAPPTSPLQVLGANPLLMDAPEQDDWISQLQTGG